MSKYQVIVTGHKYEVELDPYNLFHSDLTVIVNGEEIKIKLPNHSSPDEFIESILVNQKPYNVQVDDRLQWIAYQAIRHLLSIRETGSMYSQISYMNGRIDAPIPGLISRVFVSNGDSVKTGQAILVLEAMKMQNEIRAPKDGVIRDIFVSTGQTVTLHQLLAEID